MFFDAGEFGEDKPKDDKVHIDFTFEQILEISASEEYFMSNINVSDFHGGVLFYTDKKELVSSIQTHSIDIIFTDDPSVKNLNLLIDTLNIHSNIIVYDIANILGNETESEVIRIKAFLNRNGYEDEKIGVIGGVKVYEYRKGNTKSYIDTCIKELSVDIISMVICGSIDILSNVLLDTALLPDMIYYAEKNNKSVTCIALFDQKTSMFLEEFYDKKNAENETTKVNSITAQFEMF